MVFIGLPLAGVSMTCAIYSKSINTFYRELNNRSNLYPWHNVYSISHGHIICIPNSEKVTPSSTSPVKTVQNRQSKAVFSRQITALRDALIFLDSPRNGQLPDFCSCMPLFPLGRDQISRTWTAQSVVYLLQFHSLFFDILVFLLRSISTYSIVVYQNGPLQTRHVKYPG